jgi:hypothetical protein
MRICFVAISNAIPPKEAPGNEGQGPAANGREQDDQADYYQGVVTSAG